VLENRINISNLVFLRIIGGILKNKITLINQTSNHLSPQTIQDNKRPRHKYALEIWVLAWGRHKNVEGLNQLIVSHPHLVITSPSTIQIKTNNEKAALIFIQFIKTKQYHKNE
jgi:hypothetical protein